jgi:hypothetical protein
MKKYTKEEIASSRAWAESNRGPEVNVNLDGLSFSYFVLPQSDNPGLPSFVWQCTGNPEDGTVFGISDSVPENFRQYAVAHEVIEFREIGHDVKGRCAQALERELKLVPADIKSKYTAMRLNFFRNLIPFAEQNKYSAEDIIEFKGSLARLEEITRI